MHSGNLTPRRPLRSGALHSTSFFARRPNVKSKMAQNYHNTWFFKNVEKLEKTQKIKKRVDWRPQAFSGAKRFQKCKKYEKRQFIWLAVKLVQNSTSAASWCGTTKISANWLAIRSQAKLGLGAHEARPPVFDLERGRTANLFALID